jgi:coenzyme Q-binding protein COQ10
MPKASVKRLIECKKDQLIDLVLDIEKYPEFVPFCLGLTRLRKKQRR